MHLPYFDDPAELCSRLTPFGEPVLLDSGGENGRGRWDVIAAQSDPRYDLHLPADTSSGELRPALDDWVARAQALCTASDSGGLPFQGGFIGHFSYELGRRLQGLAPADGARLPLAHARYYPWALLQDRRARRCSLVGDSAEHPQLHLALARLLRGPGERESDPAPLRLERPFAAPWDLAKYAEAFAQVKHYIGAGDCYQINLAQPCSAPCSGELWPAYRLLREIARAPFSAWLPTGGDRRLLCLSPERFLTVDAGRVETRPIKGTRPRHADPRRDRQAARELLASEKERAENLMIVDLLRNDIGRFCRPGSVVADSLFNLESYATVHHLVSVVRGELRDDIGPLELLLGCLPGGSITGAPKRRAMEIIDELETRPREAWCGSIFYLSRHGRLDSNITIRTLFNEGGQLHCWAGGGVVDDSRADAEFREHSDKVGPFLAALEAAFSGTETNTREVRGR